jgi:hypothetical protein
MDGLEIIVKARYALMIAPEMGSVWIGSAFATMAGRLMTVALSLAAVNAKMGEPATMESVIAHQGLKERHAISSFA